MRAFIAVELPAEVSAQLLKLQEKIKDFDPEARLTFPKEFHITLKFLGEVEDKKIEQISHFLSKVPFLPFTVRLGEVGYFDDKFLKVAWVGFEDLADNLGDLQRSIDKQLIYFFQKEPKFQAHVTLARIKTAPDPEAFRERLKALKVENVDFKVTSFKLIKSTLEKAGPVYETIEEYR